MSRVALSLWQTKLQGPHRAYGRGQFPIQFTHTRRGAHRGSQAAKGFLVGVGAQAEAMASQISPAQP